MLMSVSGGGYDSLGRHGPWQRGCSVCGTLLARGNYVDPLCNPDAGGTTANSILHVKDAQFEAVS